jgi:hypothetical protein
LDGQMVSMSTRATSAEQESILTVDPQDLEIDTTERGHVLFASGLIQQIGSNRHLVGNPVTLSGQVGAIGFKLLNMRLNGQVFFDAVTGSDRIEGTASFGSASITFGDGDPLEQPGASTTFTAFRLTPEQVPANLPRVCGELCPVDITCEPPDGFPGFDVCD